MLAHAVLSLLVAAGDVAPAIEHTDAAGAPSTPDAVQIVEATDGPLRWSAVHASDRAPLDGAAFYELMGRPDLRARYESRAQLRTVAKVGGPILAVGGLAGAIWFVARPSEKKVSCDRQRDPLCVNGIITSDVAAGLETMQRVALAALIGTTTVSAGVAIGLWGARADPQVVTIDEARALAEDHARRARGDPGLDPSLLPAPPAPAATEARLELRLAPNGAALALAF
jgi:hypothetical protein